MPESVDRVLEKRRQRVTPRQRLGSVAISVALHATLTVGFVLLPLLFRQEAPKLEYVSVMVVPPAALGIESPPPPPPKPRAKPTPTPPPPPQKPTEKPAPEPPPSDVPVLPSRKRPKAAEPPPPPPSTGTTGGAAERPPRRQGSPFGNPLGASTNRALVGVEDPNFTFGYYLDRVAATITANWTRPPVEDGIEKALFNFHVLRDGTITDLELREGSGSEVFDEAARRAIEASSPLPPLPRGYKPSYLGINLVVR